MGSGNFGVLNNTNTSVELGAEEHCSLKVGRGREIPVRGGMTGRIAVL